MSDGLGMSGVGAGFGSQLLGMIGGHQAERRNYRNQRNLMNLQMQNQAGLNRQGHDLQMDMWNKTNYGAQVGHMKDAGLNPALMYKGAGAGGTTGSQGGGSASMGSSQQGRVMDMSNLLMGAQIESLKARANKDNADATKTGGIDTDKAGQEIAESIAREKNLGADEELKIANKVKAIQETTNLKTVNQWNKVKQDLDELKREKKVTGSSIVDLMTQIGLDPTNNEADRNTVRTLLGLFYGSTVAKNVMQGIGGMKGKSIKNFGDNVFKTKIIE